MQNVAWKHLQRIVGQVGLVAKEDGLLIFESQAAPKEVASFRFLNNVYLVIHQLAKADGITNALTVLLRSKDWHRPLLRNVTRKEHTFRLVLSDENQLVAGDRHLIASLNAIIQRLTHLRLSPRGANVELWILRRRSGQIFLCKRLSRRSRTERDLEKGELHPELAHLLCLLSEPHQTDIFLDPFAGSGAIPFARTHYPHNMIFAFDRRESKVNLMRARKKKSELLRIRKRSPLILRVGDALDLDRIEDGFDKVVTDPPWGFYDDLLDNPLTFYRSVLEELCRAVKPGGLVVLLLGDRDLPGLLSAAFPDRLELIVRYDILVSGKKAVVAKWRRI